jgi:hypothetical protein
MHAAEVGGTALAICKQHSPANQLTLHSARASRMNESGWPPPLRIFRYRPVSAEKQQAKKLYT